MTTIHIPGSASSLQSFLNQQNALDKPPAMNISTAAGSGDGPKVMDCFAIDVIPVPLETVYVTVERHLISNLDETQNAYAGGFTPKSGHPQHQQQQQKGAVKKTTVAEREERLKQLVRKALGSQQIVRAGNEVSLPLPPHPITYAPAPPVKVAFAEPVSQGLLMPKTRIVLIQTKPRGAGSGWRMAKAAAAKSNSKGVVMPGKAGAAPAITATTATTVGGGPGTTTTIHSSSSSSSGSKDKESEYSLNPSDTDEEDVSSNGSASATTSDQDSASSSSGSEDSLDDMEDMISLAAPELMNSPLSTPRATGPNGNGNQPQTRVFDVHTPRSYLSSSTARAASGAGMMGRSKIFKPEALVRRVPLELLHPKPSSEEDEDAVVYVDVHSLAKIGCFSGDWVRVEVDGSATGGGGFGMGESEEEKFAKGVNGLLSDLKALRSPTGGSGSNSGNGNGGNGGQSASAAMGDDGGEFRVVRVYGIAGLSHQTTKQRSSSSSSSSPYKKGKAPTTTSNTSAHRRSSISSAVTTTSTSTRSGGSIPTVLVPPLLLHNLANPKLLKLTPFSPNAGGAGGAGSNAGGIHSASALGQSLRRDQGGDKSANPQTPPTAKEVTLHKVSTPLSLDRALQSAIFGALKKHFESKKRIVKGGDLVGVSVDEGLGRVIFSGAAPGAGTADEDIALHLGDTGDASNSANSTSSPKQRKINVAWFRVSNVTFEVPDSQDPDIIHQAAVNAAAWGGVAMIDVSSTRMVTAGSQTCKILGTLNNTWEYYLGVKRLPRVHHNARSRAAAMAASTGGLASMKDLTNRPVVYSAGPQQRVKELVTAATSPKAVKLGMPPVVILLTSTQRGIGKATIASRACADIGLHVFNIDAYDILTDGGANGGSNAGGGGDVKTEAYLKARADRALACGASSTALLIRHIDVLGADRMVSAIKEVISQSRVVIATTTEIDKVAEGIRAACTHEIEVTAPEEKEREGILRNVVNEMGVKIAPEVDLAQVAVKTAALVAGDLVDVVERAIAGRTLRLEKLAEEAVKTNGAEGAAPMISVKDIFVAGGPAATCLTKADFDNAVEHARKNFADSIGAPKIPNVSWDDVGGLSHVKDAVTETIQLPLERPELFAKGMKKRSGILFYGPPGTGKTLLAKAIATEFSLNFFSVKGPELLNMYIGESEANVRRVFQRARDARPCCVFFDELDSVAPKRGNQGDSGGVMDRIVSQLLAELDGMSGGSGSSEGGDGAGESENGGGGGVFVIGATNRPDLLDPALLRPGRFDKMLYLGVSDTHAKQATILEALTRKFTLDPDVDLNRVANRLPLTYTGADLYALCSDAMLKAVTRKANAVDERIKKLAEEGVVGPSGGPVSTAWFFDHLATPEDISVMVNEDDFSEAQSELVASVSAKELEHFERIRRQFESNAEEEAKKKERQLQEEGEGSKQTVGEFMDTIKAGGLDGLSDGQTITIGASGSGSDPKGKGKGKAVATEEDDADDESGGA